MEYPFSFISAIGALFFGRTLQLPGADIAISVMAPMPTEWWLRPHSIAARVGAHSAVVWKRVYLRPPAASRSAVGMWHGPPNAVEAPKPTSSNQEDEHVGRARRRAQRRDRRILGVWVLGVIGRDADCMAMGIGSTDRCTPSVAGGAPWPFVALACLPFPLFARFFIRVGPPRTTLRMVAAPDNARPGESGARPTCRSSG